MSSAPPQPVNAPPSASSASPPRKRGPYPFYLGGLAATIAASITHPLDLTKVRLQSQVLDTTARFNGPWDCLKTTWAEEGILGLYRVSLTTYQRVHGASDMTFCFCRASPRRSSAPWPRTRPSS